MEHINNSSRSIFVENIPFEATEEELIALFNQAGPVIGFRLKYDRESGKSKGYGFCEYISPAIASNALRNLNNIEYNGRPLRIGVAAGQQNSVEELEPQQQQQADVSISEALASLPAEQLYELMVHMKRCIEDNPGEARQMLLNNSHLTYALLQAQIIMKIIEPKVAIAIMTRSSDQIPLSVSMETQPSSSSSLCQPSTSQPMGPPQSFNNQLYHQQQQSFIAPPLPPQVYLPPPHFNNPFPNFNNSLPPPTFFQQSPSSFSHNIDSNNQSNNINNSNNKELNIDSSQPIDTIEFLDSQEEKQKAALINQVLSLTDEQVAKLPHDQRRSIEVLKTQLLKS